MLQNSKFLKSVSAGTLCSVAAVISLVSGLDFCRAAWVDNDGQGLKRAASWQTPTTDQVIDRFHEWFIDRGGRSSDFDKLSNFLNESQRPTVDSQPIERGDIERGDIERGDIERLDLVIDAIAQVRSDVGGVRDRLRRAHPSPNLVVSSIDIDSLTENQFVAAHLSLYYARWLAQHQFYDEALERMEAIHIDDVLAPATLLFYRGLMEHQLLKRDQCLETMNKLLEKRDSIPRRFAVVGQLMVSDIEPMKVDSLDEVARLMNDAGRRTGLNRSGKRVRDQEKVVIKKLDKLIEDLEQQQQQQQRKNQSSDGEAGGEGPTKPLKASRVTGSDATGDVDKKSIKDGGQWGDLPPAKRAAALAEMSKEMPPHYRAVIEEYFRRLADGSAKQ